MLNIKRLTVVILTLALLTLSVVAFAACGDDSKFGNEDTMTLIIASEVGKEKEIEMNLEGLSLECNLVDVLDANNVDYDGQDSVFGFYLTKIEGLEQNLAESKSLYIYTSVQADFDVSEYASTIEFKGQKLTNSGLGVSSMTIESGCTIYIGYIIYK